MRVKGGRWCGGRARTRLGASNGECSTERGWGGVGERGGRWRRRIEGWARDWEGLEGAERRQLKLGVLTGPGWLSNDA